MVCPDIGGFEVSQGRIVTLPGGITDFEGRWSLRRVIRDARAGQVLRGEGTAVLCAEGPGWVYDEEVMLDLPGQAPIRGTRRYLWQPQGDGIAILFDDGRYFHRLALEEAQVSDHHDCAPDSYDVAYDFSGWPGWSARWHVAGPRKSYDMETLYARPSV